MIFSAKATTQLVTSALTFAVSAIIARMGFHTSPDVTAIIPGIIGLVAGAISAFIVKEEAMLAPTVSDLEAKVENAVELADRKFEAFAAQLPGPARLAAQAAEQDVKADVAALAVDAKAAVAQVNTDLEAGDLGKAKDDAVDAAEAAKQQQIDSLKQQLAALGVTQAEIDAQ